MNAEDLQQSDREILEELRKGRCTPAALTDWTSISKQTVHNRLNILVAAGHVEKIHGSGLYQLVDDPEKSN
ncbi:winged helix-turn-helix domain-containing protein [Halalkalicoccus paucihalophilus]|uniref:winged helix-turn-helix domain-containing protein n=1 Tax=Halalkalicoccus paucihalophilus TaxID=1008153 RepID=UPI000A077D69|nr:winged helix-turn-helix domain-containing protein [Halalkalicoccus paucihalophilus]